MIFTAYEWKGKWVPVSRAVELDRRYVRPPSPFATEGSEWHKLKSAQARYREAVKTTPVVLSIAEMRKKLTEKRKLNMALKEWPK